MFEAVLLVITLQKETIMLEDTRGPYAHQTQCNERLKEMEKFVREKLSVVSLKGKCKFAGEHVI